MAALDDVAGATEPLQVHGATKTALAVPIRIYHPRHAVTHTRHRGDFRARSAGIVALVREKVLLARLTLADGIGYLAWWTRSGFLSSALAANGAHTALNLRDGCSSRTVAHKTLAARLAERLAAELLKLAYGTLRACQRVRGV